MDGQNSGFAGGRRLSTWKEIAGYFGKDGTARQTLGDDAQIACAALAEWSTLNGIRL
jgi:hypothetical protein